MTDSGPGRAASTLTAPDPTRDYGDFPSYRHPGRSICSRAHGPHNPWFFSSGPGRFNLAAPRGTLNTASTPEIAAREFLGRNFVGDPVIPATMLADRWVSDLEIPEVPAADFTAGAAAAFGIVPGDVTAPMGDDYVLTRAWAAAMDTAGFGGIHSRSRFGAGQDPACLYVFGDHGQHELGTIQAKRTLRTVVHGMPGYAIDGTPPADALVIDP